MSLPLPIPFESESVGSLLLRAARGYGLDLRQFVDGAILQHPQSSTVSLERDLRVVARLTEGLSRFMDPQDFIWNHTMVPAAFPFYGQQEALLKAQEHARLTSIILWHRRSPEFCRFYRFCPECLEEQRKSLGVTYWRRDWLVWGVSRCTRHNVPLLVTPMRLVGDEPTLLPGESEGTTLATVESRNLASVRAVFGSDEERLSILNDGRSKRRGRLLPAGLELAAWPHGYWNSWLSRWIWR